MGTFALSDRRWTRKEAGEEEEVVDMAGRFAGGSAVTDAVLAGGREVRFMQQSRVSSREWYEAESVVVDSQERTRRRRGATRARSPALAQGSAGRVQGH